MLCMRVLVFVYIGAFVMFMCMGKLVRMFMKMYVRAFMHDMHVKDKENAQACRLLGTKI
jgi:hypothetical protein